MKEKKMRIDGLVLTAMGSILLAASPATAQVPELVRIDLTIGWLIAPESRGSFGGAFPARPGFAGPVDALALLDATATVNISSRITVAAGLPMLLTLGPADRHSDAGFDRRLDGGIGDVHAHVSVATLGERRFFPGLTIGAEAGAPTATLSYFGAGLWRTTARWTVSKSLHPRFSIFGDGTSSEFVPDGPLRIEPMRTVGGGLTVGITRASLLNLRVDRVKGGSRQVGGRTTLPELEDLQATAGVMRFSRGRPRVSFVVSAAGLRDDPTFVISLTSAILSK